MFGLMIFWGVVSIISWNIAEGVWLSLMLKAMNHIDYSVFAWIDYNINGPVILAVLVFLYGMGYSTNGGASVNKLIEDDIDYMG